MPIFTLLLNSAIIFYLGFLAGVNYHFEKLGQCDLNKKNYVKICKIHISTRTNILVCSNHYDLTYFQ